MRSRAVIVARIRPGTSDKVAEVFAESDAGELPRLAGVRHRSLFVLQDVYVHLVETDGDVDGAVEQIRDHDLFREISARLEPYIAPYDPATWRSPKDAMAVEFYRWDA
ncbi:MAG: cyclase [Solirubrobacteraceae bacterium]|nr:cyclase [Solirubrobacteraceae bacterium]